MKKWLFILFIILLACGGGGCDKDGVRCTPDPILPPPDWTPTPAPTADYSVW
jgi:hypothetical protein